MKSLVAPSLLAADFGNLAEAVALIERSDADWYHVDVMDGVFVPNISFGMPVMEFLARSTTKPLDVHLMIVEPERYIEAFAALKTQILTVHLEASRHLHRTIQQIHAAGMKAGVALNPHTSVDTLVDILDEVDLVLVMSVNPGFGGQSFIPRALEKVARLNQMRKERGLNFLIEVDGGVKDENSLALVQAGADVLVAGNFVFKAQDPDAAIRAIKHTRVR